MAAVDYFIKFEGIKGESADAKHKDEIDVESWSWGETRAGSPQLAHGQPLFAPSCSSRFLSADSYPP
jgi:type VI protein secretion system component Hcp